MPKSVVAYSIMKKELKMSKQVQTPTDVVRCEFSGNRANAYDTDCVKRTSEITVGARQKAAKGNYLLGRFKMKNGKFQWRKVDAGEVGFGQSNTINNSSEVFLRISYLCFTPNLCCSSTTTKARFFISTLF